MRNKKCKMYRGRMIKINFTFSDILNLHEFTIFFFFDFLPL